MSDEGMMAVSQRLVVFIVSSATKYNCLIRRRILFVAFVVILLILGVVSEVFSSLHFMAVNFATNATFLALLPLDSIGNPASPPPFRILLLVIDYKPPSPRLMDLLTNYQHQVSGYQQEQQQSQQQLQQQQRPFEVDFYFLCTDNYQFASNLTLPCREAASAVVHRNDNNSAPPRPTIKFPYLILDEAVARDILAKCPYCTHESTLGWSAYMGPLLALRQLKVEKAMANVKSQQHHLPRNNSNTNTFYHYCDVVWSTDPDAEFLGNITEWLIQQETALLQTNVLTQQSSLSSSSLSSSSPPLVSSLIMPSVELAHQHFQPGMYARIDEQYQGGMKCRAAMFASSSESLRT